MGRAWLFIWHCVVQHESYEIMTWLRDIVMAKDAAIGSKRMQLLSSERMRRSPGPLAMQTDSASRSWHGSSRTCELNGVRRKQIDALPRAQR